MDPFELQPHRDASFLDRLLGRKPGENAVVELNNLLAAAHHVNEVSLDDVHRIGDQYGVDLHGAYGDRRKRLYQDYLIHLLADARLSGREEADLAHLQELLGLNPADLAPVHETAFRHSVDALIADGWLDEADRAALEALRTALGLTRPASEAVYRDQARHHLLWRITDVLADGRLSPAEETALRARYEKLDMVLPSEIELQLTRARHLWQAEQEALPLVRPGVALEAGESCHFLTPAHWFRTYRPIVPKRDGIPSYEARLRAHASPPGERVREDRLYGNRLEAMGTGRLLLTSRRIFLAEQPNECHVVHGRIADFIPFENGVLILRTSGTSFFLQFEDRLELFSTILARILAEQRKKAAPGRNRRARRAS